MLVKEVENQMKSKKYGYVFAAMVLLANTATIPMTVIAETMQEPPSSEVAEKTEKQEKNQEETSKNTPVVENQEQSQEVPATSEEKVEEEQSKEETPATTKETPTVENEEKAPEVATNAEVETDAATTSHQEVRLEDWKIQDYRDYVNIIQYTGSDPDIVVPNEINGKPVRIHSLDRETFPIFNSTTPTSFKILPGKDGSKMIVSVGRIDFSNTSFKTIDLSGIDATYLSNIAGRFSNCKSLTSVNLADWKLNKITNIESMFDGCSSLTSVNLSNWYFAGNTILNSSRMFRDCSSLTSVDFSSWRNFCANDISYMFQNCSSLTSANLSSWDPTGYKPPVYIQHAFENCSSLKFFDMTKIVEPFTNMESAFSGVSDILVVISHHSIGDANNKNFDFEDVLRENFSNLRPLSTPVLDATGGLFNNRSNTKQYFTQLTYTRQELERINKVTDFDQFKNDNIPTKEGATFRGWKLIEGNDSGAQNVYPDLYGTKYEAQWDLYPVTVKVNFVNETGESIKAPETITGYLGQEYDLTNIIETPIPGYKLDETKLPNDVKGSFSGNAKEITLTYKVLDINIPSQNVDNTKPGEISSYGIAYTPKQFQSNSIELNDSGSQSIPINKTSRFDVGVRDLSNTGSQWTLKARLVWDTGKELQGSYIKTTNHSGAVMKNINNGVDPFNPDTDLTDSNNEVQGMANVEITSTQSTPLMVANKVAHNAIYNYNLGDVSLEIPETRMIQPGTYKGYVEWNLSNTL